MDQQPYSFTVLMDVLKEEQLLGIMVDMIEEIQDCVDDARGAAVKFEMAFRRFLQRIDKPLPPGAFWQSDPVN